MRLTCWLEANPAIAARIKVMRTGQPAANVDEVIEAPRVLMSPPHRLHSLCSPARPNDEVERPATTFDAEVDTRYSCSSNVAAVSGSARCAQQPGPGEQNNHDETRGPEIKQPCKVGVVGKTKKPARYSDRRHWCCDASEPLQLQGQRR